MIGFQFVQHTVRLTGLRVSRLVVQMSAPPTCWAAVSYVLYVSRTLQLSHKNMSIVARIITAIKITVQTIAQVFSSRKRLMYGYLCIPRCPVRLF